MIRLIPFLLIFVVLLFTAAVIGAILARARYTREQGLTALLYPFVPLFLSGFCEALRVLADLTGNHTPLLQDIASSVRMLNGLGWFLLLQSNLKLHGILGKRKRMTLPVILVTSAACVFYIVSAVLGRREPALSIGLGLMSATGLFTAVSSLFIIRVKIRLWPAARAGIHMAIFALIAYPSALVGERLRFPFPFIDPDRSGFEQAFPVFLAVFTALAIPALIAKGKGLGEKVRPEILETLTSREKEVVDLLLKKSSLKEIAQELTLSVPTVKSHANNAYRKLGVSGRKELQELNFG